MKKKKRMLISPATSIAVIACVCCKCTSCKCRPKAKKAAVCCSCKREHEIKTAVDKDGKPKVRQSSSDEDDSYHIRGERHIPKKINKPMQKIPKLTQRKACSEASTSQHRHFSVELDSSGLYSYVRALSTTNSEFITEEKIEFIDAEGDDPSCFSEKSLMKRGFKQLNTAETTNR